MLDANCDPDIVSVPIRYDPLPAGVRILPYPGLRRRLIDLYNRVQVVRDQDDGVWDVMSSTGRLVKQPIGDYGRVLCPESVARVMVDLRDTATDHPIFAVEHGGSRLWKRTAHPRVAFRPISSVQYEYGILAPDKYADIERFVRHVTKQTGSQVVPGVKFRNCGFCRRWVSPVRSETVRVRPDDPLYALPWALDLSGIDYDKARVQRFRANARAVIIGDEGAEMISRVVAAPVAQPYMHGMAILTGPGGSGKGSLIQAMAGLYGPLANPFSLNMLIGHNASSTSAEQAPVPLLTGLMAYDEDACDPGAGNGDILKKATVGEPVSMRKLGHDVVTAAACAFLVVATNHGSSLPSEPEWRRRAWYVPFRFDTSEETVLRWRDYLGSADDPDSGIIDALMGGCISFAKGRPDPATTTHIVDDLSTFGRTLRDMLMSCAPVDPETGIPDRPRVPVRSDALTSLRASEQEKRQQMRIMGVKADSLRDIHGDKSTKQMYYVDDQTRFAPFAQAWTARQRANEEERRAEEERDSGQLLRAARTKLLDAPLVPAEPGVAGQIGLLRQVAGYDATVITPREDQWAGKGIRASWTTDETIRHPLREVDLSSLPSRYGLSVDEHTIIIDLDASHSGDDAVESGLDTIMRIPDMRVEDLDTLAMRSPQGCHLVYRMPESWVGRVKASTHVNGSLVDLRPGQSSYVVGPGSVLACDGQTIAYPGVVGLPSETSAEWGGSVRRMLPILPRPLADWIERDGKCLRRPARQPDIRVRPDRPAVVDDDDDSHVYIPPMMPGATHDVLRDTALRIAGRAAHRGYDRQWLDGEMDRLRAAVPAGHDPRDTDACIASAIDKAYSGG